MQHFKKLPFILLICALVLPLMVAPVFASDHIVVVNTNPDDGWTYNPDPANATPAGFATDEASIGIGSLHAAPITNGTNAQKFILTYVPGSEILIEDLEQFSIDFLIDDEGLSKVNQFYVNLYTFAPAPSDGTYYDCRFDFVATSGSTTEWTQLGFASGDTATAVADQWAGGVCPTSPEGMPAGSTVFFIAVNIGDTSGNDTGVGGYFDNANLTVAGSTTTFDFEPSINDCKNNGWQSLKKPDGSSFKNQGDCIQYINTGK